MFKLECEICSDVGSVNVGLFGANNKVLCVLLLRGFW